MYEITKISVLVNGSASNEFKPKRGLRQGDPLSPLFFNLVGEVLAKLLHVAKQIGIFQGILLPNSEDPISHLQFDDDVILFINNDSKSVKGVKRVLQCFELLSGLSINFQKSNLYGFSKDHSILNEWANILCCSMEKGTFKYLGAVIGASPSSSIFWNPPVSRIKNKLESWDSDHLSLA